MMRYIASLPLTALTGLLPACGDQTSTQLQEPTQVEFTVAAECQALIDDLRSATAGVESFRSEKDQLGLLGKLDNAARALSAGKNADAVQKLTDFSTKVTTLQQQGKLASADAESLIAGAGSAIACINGL